MVSSKLFLLLSFEIFCQTIKNDLGHLLGELIYVLFIFKYNILLLFLCMQGLCIELHPKSF